MTGARTGMLVSCLVGLWLGCLIGIGALPALAAGGAPPAGGAELNQVPQTPPAAREMRARIDELCEEGRHDFAAARALCQQAHDAATNDEERAYFLRRLGIVIKRQGDFDGGIAVFKQVIERYPQSAMQTAWAKLDLANGYMGKGKFKLGSVTDNAALALPIVEQFLRDYPDYIDGAGRALEIAGWCYEQLGNEGAAVAAYQRVISCYPNASVAPRCLAALTRLQHQEPTGEEAALAACLAVVDSHPESKEAPERLLEAIWHQQKLGQWDDAIASAQRYMERYPDREPDAVHLRLGVCYAGKGDSAAALAEYKQALTYYAPENPRQARLLAETAGDLMALELYREVHPCLALIIANPAPRARGWREYAQYLDGIAYYQARDYEHALAALRTVAASSSSTLQAQIAQRLVQGIEAKAAGQ